MKKDIHPKYHALKVTCSCGNNFTTNSTIESGELHVDICSQCHPFYTGKQKAVDTAGRVDRFKQKYIAKTQPIEKPKAAEAKPAKKAVKKTAAKKPAKAKKPAEAVAE